MSEWIRCWVVTLRMRLFRRSEWKGIQRGRVAGFSEFVEVERPGVLGVSGSNHQINEETA